MTWAENSLAEYWNDLAQKNQEMEQESAQIKQELLEYQKKQKAINEETASIFSCSFLQSSHSEMCLSNSSSVPKFINCSYLLHFSFIFLSFILL